MASPPARPLCVMLVAAETSGDALGAKLVAALRAKLGDHVRFVGVGGPRMAAEGVDSPFDISELSVLGLVEGLAAYPTVVRRVRDTVALARRETPDVAVLIDSWGFTLRVAQALRRAFPGVRLVKYVGPQVWASRPGRARTLARSVDHLLTLHSFDAPFFERHGLPVTFVGNAILARDFSKADPARLRAAIGAGAADPILLVAPGSRGSEIARMAGPLGEAVAHLSATRPNLHVVVPVAASVAPAVREAASAWAGRVTLIDDDGLKDDAMAGATAALACSGTVTTELALAGPPVVVGYRIGKLTYALLRRMVRTPWISLVNVAAGRMVMPEFIQDRCTGEALAQAVAPLLDEPQARAQQVAAQQESLTRMGRGGPDPSEAAALAVLKVVGAG
jgi:lipid-A-disaccharide synthase